ncbi:MAG: UDP-N-acetyl-D-mannosamine dehydrogenase [Pseudomonadota bacterium]
MNNFQINKIAVMGLGYIGLPTATLFANQGIPVLGVDINKTIVDTVNQGKIHIVEPDLDRMVEAVIRAGRLRATTECEPADVFIIAVPTPFKGDHKPDLSYIESAATMLAPKLVKGNLVILESTSPVGTSEQLARWLSQDRSDLSFPLSSDDPDINICYCPERVIPGKVLHELTMNDRILGGMTPRCAQKAKQVYELFVKGECLTTDAKTAELAKLTENSYRDVNIAFANEMSLVCDRLGVDIWELIRLANHHPRVNILQPGAGVGGHCIAVDPWFIVDSAKNITPLIQAARQVNNFKPQYILKQIEKLLMQHPHSIVACLGLSYKPDIDDLRESPAIKIVNALSKQTAIKELLVVEPHVTALPASLKGKIELTDGRSAIERANIIVVLVPHTAFNQIDQTTLKDKLLINPTPLWR